MKARASVRSGPSGSLIAVTSNERRWSGVISVPGDCCMLMRVASGRKSSSLRASSQLLRACAMRVGDEARAGRQRRLVERQRLFGVSCSLGVLRLREERESGILRPRDPRPKDKAGEHPRDPAEMNRLHFVSLLLRRADYFEIVNGASRRAPVVRFVAVNVAVFPLMSTVM